MARTAVVAGTATAVSNRVSRRQAGRWARQDGPESMPGYMAPQPAGEAPPMPPAAPPAGEDRIGQLKELASLHDSGALTDQEFAAEKARILGP